MKKILFLLLFITSFLQAQTLQNPIYGNTTTNTLKIKMPATVTSVNFLSTNEADGSVSKIAPINVTIPYTPVNYTASTQSIGSHLSGIDTRLGQISSTTAGITQRVYFTADNTTVNSVVYFASSLTGKGSTATGSPPALVLPDNTKAYFTKDVISIAQPSATIGYAGTYSGNLTVSATPTPVATQQRFTVEIYRTNNLGVPIASGVSGAPTGDLGVTVLAILDSGIINLSAGSITNVPVSGILTQNVTINTGERLRYHVSAAKIGTGGGSVTFGVYYGSSYNSYYDVPVAITTDAVLNKSSVTGVTNTDALNALNTGKQNALTNPVTGTGNTDYIPIFTGTSTLVSSSLRHSSIFLEVIGRPFRYINDVGSAVGFHGDEFAALGTGSKMNLVTYVYGPTNSHKVIVDGSIKTVTNSSGFEVAGNVKINTLSGTGTRQVVADASGNLSATDTYPISGTYTPTLTNTTNITSSTFNYATYIKVGDVVTVTVSAVVNVTTTNTLGKLAISLPVNRTSTTAYEVGSGVGFQSGLGSQFFPVFCQMSTNTSQADLWFRPTNSGNHTVVGTFSYKVN